MTKRKTNLKNDNKLKDVWYNIKRINILIAAVPEGDEREKWSKMYLMKLQLKNSQS